MTTASHFDEDDCRRLAAPPRREHLLFSRACSVVHGADRRASVFNYTLGRTDEVSVIFGSGAHSGAPLSCYANGTKCVSTSSALSERTRCIFTVIAGVITVLIVSRFPQFTVTFHFSRSSGLPILASSCTTFTRSMSSSRSR